VVDLPEAPGRCAGLLLEWAPAERYPGAAAGSSWVGRVVYAVVDAGQTRSVEAWVDARHLRPA
jgi:hypothetical protein